MRVDYRRAHIAMAWQLLNRSNVGAAREVIVVGDKSDSEIEAGNSLGLGTVRILRSGVARSEKAARQIHRLIELTAFL